ncbi:MAG: hypothetical protein KKH94_09060 [Candidatus Omnitrophica bacterium]|nr:hypothetical protein [Candidatus Omnitrophota bacterium]
MKRRKITLTVLVGILLLAVCMVIPMKAHADGVHYATISSASITATGSLAGSTTLTATLLNDTDGVAGLTFTSAGTLVIAAPETLKVEFSDNTAGYQSMIISTNNSVSGTGIYTGSGAGAGLVGGTDSTVNAPLHWTVFATQADAAAYSFTTKGDGYVDEVVQYYVADRSEANFDSANALGYASVVSGIADNDGSLANAPYDTATGVDDDSNPATPSQNDGTQRSVTNGEAYIRFAVDYHGVPAQNYSTNSLTLAVVTIS